MSRTACCFVALGISFAAFAAACGDDDGGGGTGGNGGNGASGGSGGGANVAGEGGTAGMANTAGEGGTAGAGTAGTAGAGNAGTAGAGNAGTAGTTGVVDTDAGPDSGTGDQPDSGVGDAGNQAPPDSGTVGGTCPNFATTTAQTAAQNSQPITIVRVTFNGDGTGTVVFRSTDSADVGGFNLGDIAEMCTGPEDADCVDPTDLGLTGTLALDSETTLNNVEGLDAAGGELVLTVGGSGLPSDVNTGTLAYVAWGTSFVSEAPAAGGALLSWEDRAVADGFWTGDDRIPLTGSEDTFVCGGDTALAASFTVCTANP